MTKSSALLSALTILGAFIGTLSANAEAISVGIGIDAAYAPFFIAQHRGLFKKHGLEVEIVKFSQGGEAVDAAVARQVQITGAAEQTTMIRMARADLRALAIYEESGSYLKLVSRPGITDPTQIKTYGIVKGTVSEYATALTLKKYDINPQSVSFVPMGPPELPALLARGDIDGYFVWEPWPGIGLKQGAHLLATSGDVGYAYTMWATVSGPWLETHTADAKAFLDAMAEANRQIAADPAKAAEDLQAETKLPASDTLPFLKSTDWKVRDFTAKDFESFDKIADFMVAQKIVPAKVDFRKSIMSGFYKE